MSELVGRGAIELAEMVRRHEVKPTEVVEAHLRQVEALEPRLHAFLALRAERAMDEARELEKRPDLAELPLAGVPTAMKDSVDVAGEPTRLGSLATSDAPAEADDELTTRVRHAGAIVIGKTRQPELAIFHNTDSRFGTTRNPWNLERAPGGSSGGAGAAVASAMIPLAQASDGGGSIRIPAAFCGLFGIKPGPGIVPVAGGHGEHWFGMSQWGPLSTTVADGALLLDVLAGTNRYRDVAPASRPLRLALSTRPPALGVRTDAEVRAAAEACADVLREAGHTVTLTDPPYSQRLTAAFLHRFLGGVAHEVDQLGLDVQRLEPGHRGMVRAGRYINRTRPVPPDGADEWRNRFTAWFADYDLLLTPTTARTAVRADGWVAKSWLLKVQDGSQNVPFTQAWNVASFPAASVPAGLSRAGMPIGLQVIAPRGGEALVLSLALQLERLRPWPRHAPLARVPAPTLAEVAGG